MFFFRGGQQVKRGTYSDLEHEKITLAEEGILPGSEQDIYFRFPESSLLIAVFLFGLALSMAIPYGLGTALFLCLAAVTVVIIKTVRTMAERFRKD